MSSQIEICNEALIALGAPTITDIDDNTKSAKLCKKLYDRVVKRVLGEGPWSNATQRVALAKLTSTPAYGYDSEFQLPNDTIKVWAINDEIAGDYDYRIENNKLLIDIDAVSIQYTRHLTNTGDYGEYLASSVADALAYKMAYAFTGTRSGVEGLRNLYKSELQHNLAMDNQQGAKDQIVTRAFTEIR